MSEPLYDPFILPVYIGISCSQCCEHRQHNSPITKLSALTNRELRVPYIYCPADSNWRTNPFFNDIKMQNIQQPSIWIMGFPKHLLTIPAYHTLSHQATIIIILTLSRAVERHAPQCKSYKSHYRASMHPEASKILPTKDLTPQSPFKSIRESGKQL